MQRKQKQKVSHKSRIWIGAVVLLLVAAAGVFIFVRATRTSSQAGAGGTVRQSAASSAKAAPQQVVNFSQLMGNRLNTQGLPVVGDLSIPDLKINLPIFTGSDMDQITYGAGTTGADSAIGAANLALASHHIFDIAGADAMLFSPLTRATTGMTAYVTDGKTVYNYSISKIYQVDSSDLSVLDAVPHKKVLTLIYCLNREGPVRVIVRGTLTKSYSINDASTAVQQALAAPWNQIPANELPQLNIYSELT